MGERPLIALDTHAWVWWVSGSEQLPSKAKQLIEHTVASGGHVLISSISTWEVAMLVAGGRLELTTDLPTWIARVEALPFVEFVPVDNRIALRAVHLEGFPHRDLADRLIVATALGMGATLVTGDSRLRGYRHVKTAWE